MKFFSASIAEFDLAKVDHVWTDDHFEVLDERLKQLQRIVSATQRSDAETLRSVFVKINKVAEGYYTKHYKSNDDRQISNVIYEEHWRKYIHADLSDVLSLQEKKMARLKYRLKNKYVVDYNEMTTRFRKYANNMELDESNFTKRHACELNACIQFNAGGRKIATLDPQIRWYTYDDYMEHLKKTGKVKPSVFLFGDTKNENVKIPDLDAALETFGRKNLIVQVGVGKDPVQKLNKHLIGPSDPRWVPNSTVIKPTMLFSAKDTIKMIEKVRSFFGLTDETRPKGVEARRIIGSKIGTRDMLPILEKDWPELISHARRHGYRLSTHIFRKMYSAVLGSTEMEFVDKIYMLSGVRIDTVVLQSVCLHHTGSFSTVQAYSNIYINFATMNAKLLGTPPKKLLVDTLTEMEYMREDNAKMKKEMAKMKAELEQAKMVNSALDLSPEGIVQQNLDSRYIPARWPKDNNKASDADMKFVMYTLKQANIKLTRKNIMKMGKIGDRRYASYKQRHSPLLPVDYKPPSTAQKKRSREEFDENEKKNPYTADVEAAEARIVPHGTKVIVPQQEVKGSKKKQKTIINRNKQAVKRDATRFNGKDNVTTECTGDKIEEDVKLAGVQRDLCVL